MQRTFLISILSSLVLLTGFLNPVVNAADTTPLFLSHMTWETNSLDQPITQPTYGKNHNVIYYYQPSPDILHGEIHAAVKAWNQLHVIKLVRVTRPQLAGFVISFNDDPVENRNASGVTIYQNTPASLLQSAHFKHNHVHIYIEPIVALWKSRADRVSVVEHEIGHALGFAHDAVINLDPDNHHLYTVGVMSPGNLTYPGLTQTKTYAPGWREQLALQQHYQAKS